MTVPFSILSAFWEGNSWISPTGYISLGASPPASGAIRIDGASYGGVAINASGTITGSVGLFTGAAIADSAAKTIINYVAGTTAQFKSYGPDNATAGAIQFVGLSANGTIGDIRLTISATGAASFGTNSITAGAASFTTGAFSGDVNVGSGKFVATAATGAVALLGNLAVGAASVTNGTGWTRLQQVVAAGSAVFSVLDTSAPAQQWDFGVNAKEFDLFNVTAGIHVLVINQTTHKITTAGSLAITGALTGVTTLGMSSLLTISSAATSAAGAGTDIVFGATTQTTIGANGAASALTANPLGYLVFYKGTTKCVIPYYNG